VGRLPDVPPRLSIGVCALPARFGTNDPQLGVEGNHRSSHTPLCPEGHAFLLCLRRHLLNEVLFLTPKVKPSIKSLDTTTSLPFLGLSFLIFCALEYLTRGSPVMTDVYKVGNMVPKR